ncbi:MAG: alpha/beta hydrolase [SAR324 cluster bacterium]|nr:alpha/beta hydrolase [SAR324 cluster bacterium]
MMAADHFIEMMFQHGWAFDSSCWEKWLQAFPDNVDLLFEDRGYYGPVRRVSFQRQDSFKIVVAHSMGLWWLSESALSQCDRLILLGCFEGLPPEIEGKPLAFSRSLPRMIRKFREQPLSVLRDFFKYCDCPDFFMENCDLSINLELLMEDLVQLKNNRMDLELLENIPDILMFHGTQDQIIPLRLGTQLQQQLSQSQLILVPDAGHALPVVLPDVCPHSFLSIIA